MTLELDAMIHKKGPAVRECVNTICRDIDLDSVRNPTTIKGYVRLRSFICGLGQLNLRLHEIAKIADVEPDFALRVLKERRQYGVPVRTQRW